MKKTTKRNPDPEKVLKNLRDMIEEAEDVLAQGQGHLNQEQISELRERVMTGLNRLRTYSGEVGGRVKDYYGDAETRLREYYEEVEDRLRASVETTDRTIRSHPYRIAAVCFGVGVALGAIVRATGRDR